MTMQRYAGLAILKNVLAYFFNKNWFLDVRQLYSVFAHVCFCNFAKYCFRLR